MSTERTGSFADRIDFPALYEGLSEKGIHFSAEEKERFEKIAKDAMRERDAASKIGTNLGADFQSLGIFILALFKKIFGGTDGPADMLSNFGDNFGQAAEQTNFIKFNYALQDIHFKLSNSGNSNFQRAAELITGQHAGRDRLPENMQASIRNQLIGDINVPEGASVSLDTYAVNGDLAAPPHRLPPQPRTRALT